MVCDWWCVVSGVCVWCVIGGVWSVVCGVWCVCVVCDWWCVVGGVWCVVCGVWCVVCGVWSEVCGAVFPTDSTSHLHAHSSSLNHLPVAVLALTVQRC